MVNLKETGAQPQEAQDVVMVPEVLTLLQPYMTKKFALARSLKLMILMQILYNYVDEIWVVFSNIVCILSNPLETKKFNGSVITNLKERFNCWKKNNQRFYIVAG